jgi:hypothetical protein
MSPSCSSSPYAFTTVFGLIDSESTTSSHGRQALTRAQAPQHHLAANLLHELSVDRDTRPSLESEHGRSLLPSLY